MLTGSKLLLVNLGSKGHREQGELSQHSRMPHSCPLPTWCPCWLHLACGLEVEHYGLTLCHYTFPLLGGKNLFWFILRYTFMLFHRYLTLMAQSSYDWQMYLGLSPHLFSNDELLLLWINSYHHSLKCMISHCVLLRLISFLLFQISRSSISS